ncbi:MGDG synthase family glycosyltransferase [Aminipila sp.]|uniref:MGDG synthase family glycosyltransferase n=1 Tax=Aminipila sp. TaxID=2060095 RepID=UPI002897B9DB|nr:glycosyltransferase [Aminipila sp.]
MNILILTGRFGMGHCSAAEALRQEILLKDPEAKVDVVDIIDYMLPSFSNLLYGTFNFMVSKCSKIYNFLYEQSAKYCRAPFKRTFIKKVDSLLNTFEPKLIISTLPICSQYISAYKSMKFCSIPLHTYITDIKAHEEWIAKNTDMYFVGSRSTKNTLISKGIPGEKIVISGIPVKPVFREKNICKNLGGTKEVLIIGGGLGLIPSSEMLLKRLSKNKSLHITIITGKNKKLFLKIKKEFPEMEVMGYTSKVDEYMKKADIVITKSGGITTFEAINCETPLYIIRPFLSQEWGNAEYIENLNIGRVLWSENTDVAEDILSLIENKNLLNEMQENMRKIKSHLYPVVPLLFCGNRGEELCF